MKLTKSAEKLGWYYARLGRGEAGKIKIGHVDRVLKKLKAKRAKIASGHAAAQKETRRNRLKRKLTVIDEQLERAGWLREALGKEQS